MGRGIRQKVGVLEFAAFGLWVVGCQYEVEPLGMDINPDHIGSACAGYTACTNHLVGFGICYVSIDFARHWDLKGMSFDLATRSDLEAINIVSGIQNTACLAHLGGGCDNTLACVNQARAVIGCTPKEGYFQGRYCRDENTLAACTKTYADNSYAESSVRCDDIGMHCVEFDRETDRLAACGFWADNVVEGISVNCEGALARIQRQNVYFYWDCGLMNARCRAGTYQSWDNYEFCDSDGLPCDVTTMTKHCDGSLLVNWCNGKEVGLDCRRLNRTCEETTFLAWTFPMCVYADSGCNPYNFEETCHDGVITYCGPNGVTSFSCKEAGYSNCEIDLVFAQCRE